MSNFMKAFDVVATFLLIAGMLMPILLILSGWRRDTYMAAFVISAVFVALNAKFKED